MRSDWMMLRQYEERPNQILLCDFSQTNLDSTTNIRLQGAGVLLKDPGILLQDPGVL